MLSEYNVHTYEIYSSLCMLIIVKDVFVCFILSLCNRILELKLESRVMFMHTFLKNDKSQLKY